MVESCNLDPVLPDVRGGPGLTILNGSSDFDPGIADAEVTFS